MLVYIVACFLDMSHCLIVVFYFYLTVDVCVCMCVGGGGEGRHVWVHASVVLRAYKCLGEYSALAYICCTAFIFLFST